MYQYSPSEKEFVKVALSYGLRVDGRTPDMRRTTETKCDVLDNLAGSSYISIDHGKCQIYTGIKLKISNTNQGSSLQSKIHVSLSSMRKLSRAQNDIMVYLQQLLELHFINKEIKGFKQLKIPNSKRHYFQLHIETFILAEPHLSLIQPLYLAIRKALASTSVPKLDCFYNEITNQQTVQLTDQEQSLTIGQIDALILVGQQQKTLILDMTPLQFQTVDSVLLITVKSQKVQSVQSLKGSIRSQQMHKICRFAINGSK